MLEWFPYLQYFFSLDVLGCRVMQDVSIHWCPARLESPDGYSSYINNFYDTWTSKRASNNGPISQNRDYRQYRVRHFGHFGGPGRSKPRVIVRHMVLAIPAFAQQETFAEAKA